MKIGLSQFSGRLNGHTFSGSRYRPADGRRDTWAATLSTNVSATSTIEAAERSLSHRRASFRSREKSYESTKQQHQRHHQAFENERRHKDMGESKVRTEDAFATGGAAGAYKGIKKE